MPTIQKTRAKVRGFAQLPEGWHFGKGIAPSPEARSAAQSLLGKAEQLDFQDVDAFPGVDGEIQVAIYRGEDDYEFTIEANGTITFAHDLNGRERSYQTGLSLGRSLVKLERLSNQVWASLGLSTPNIMLDTRADSAAWLSKTPVTDQEYQLLKENVLNRAVGQSVLISPNVTQQLLGIQSSIGPFQTISYPTDVLLSVQPVTGTIVTTTSEVGKTTLPEIKLRPCA